MDSSHIVSVREKVDFSKIDRSGDVIDQYVIQHSLRLEPAQLALRQETKKDSSNNMMSSPDEMQLVQLLLRATNAKKVVEIGVYTGYGCLSMALALPEDGKVIGCETDEKYIDIARPFWQQAGVDKKIDVRLGPALDTLNNMLGNGEAETVDLVFLDADKPNYGSYYELSLKLVRQNGLVIIDNTLWSGKVLREAAADDAATRAIQKLNDKLATDDRVDISMLKLADGTTILRKR